jgi:hypothetical protein
MVREVTILDYLRYDIIKRYWINKYQWHIDDLLTYLFAQVYPFIGNILYIKEEIAKETNSSVIDRLQGCGTIEPLVSELSRLIKKEKKVNLSLLSQSSLEAYFRIRYLPILTSEAKQKLIAGLTYLKGDAEGLIIFTKSEKYLENVCLRELPSLETHYGEDQFPVGEVSVDNGGLDRGQGSEEVINEGESGTESEVKTGADTAPETNDTLIAGDPIRPQIDNAHQRRRNNRDVDISPINDIWKSIGLTPVTIIKPFFWKNKLSTSNYKELKTDLINFFDGRENRFITLALENYDCALLVAFYVSEWYKREYSENANNGLMTLHRFPADIAENVWETLLREKPEWRRYRYEGERNTTHLFSLYMLGGLPVNYYVSNDNKGGALMDLISHRYDNPEAYNENESWNSKIDRLSNSVALKSSINNCHSISEYIDECINNRFPFNDNTEYPYKQFIDLVSSRKEQDRDRYSVSWIFRYSCIYSYVGRSLIITPRKNNCVFRHFISHEQFQRWTQAQVLPKSFSLSVSFNQIEEHQITFSSFSERADGEYYVCESQDDIIRIDEIPNCDISSVSFYINYFNPDGLIHRDCLSTIETAHVFHMFKKGPYEWQEIRGSRQYSQSAIFFDDNWELPDVIDNEIKQLSFGEGTRGIHFYELEDDCTILRSTNADGKSRIFNRTSSKMVIEYAEFPQILYEYKDYSNWFSGGRIRSCYDGKTRFLPLLIGPNSIKGVNLIDAGDKKTPLEQKQYNVKIRHNSHLGEAPDDAEDQNLDFVPYDKDFIKPGFATIIVKQSVEDGVSVDEQRLKYQTQEVFFLPEGSIRRDLVNHHLGVIGIAADIHVSASFHNISEDSDCYIVDDSRVPIDSHYISFKVGIGNFYVNLNVLTARRLDLIIVDKRHYFAQSRTAHSDRRPIELQELLVHRTIVLKIADDVERINPQNNQDYTINQYKDMIRKRNRDGFHFICNNRNEDDNTQYKFFWWQYNPEEELKKIVPNYSCNDGNGIVNVTLPNGRDRSSMIVFQSLKDVSPRYYYEPPVNSFPQTITITIELLEKCFMIAQEHDVYFKMFLPLSRLADGVRLRHCRQDTFIDGFFNIVKKKNKHNDFDKALYESFCRFAQEFIGNDHYNSLKNALERVRPRDANYTEIFNKYFNHEV